MRLVLAGGGHAHVEVLRAFGRRPAPGVCVTLISGQPDTPYSGMLPGVIAGHYTRRESHIALAPLAAFAPATFAVDEADGLDLSGRLVHRRGGPSVPWDVLSLDIGSTPGHRNDARRSGGRRREADRRTPLAVGLSARNAAGRRRKFDRGGDRRRGGWR
jgi:NADH dehydrogenase FAD-containing subunit